MNKILHHIRSQLGFIEEEEEEEEEGREGREG